jgi:predicted NBD/HSP70 family sugar kinase
MSQKELVHDLSLSRPTVSSAIAQLKKEGLVDDKEKAKRSGPGRPRSLIRPVLGDSIFAGVSISVTQRNGPRLMGVLTDRTATVLPNSRRDRKLRGHKLRPSSVTHQIRCLLDDLLEQSESAGKLTALGISVGGHVQSDKGLIINSPNLKWVSPIDLGQQLEDLLSIPVVLENDANALALYESAFSLERPRDFALVLISDGIGASIVSNGHLFHGRSGGAGELGHIVVELPGRECDCGRKGCLQTVSSYSALAAAAEKKGFPAEDQQIDRIVDLANQGSLDARRLLSHAGRTLGFGLSALANICDPGLIVLSTEALIRSDHFKVAVENVIDDHTFPGLNVELQWIETEFAHAAAGASWAAILRYPRLL